MSLESLGNAQDTLIDFLNKRIALKDQTERLMAEQQQQYIMQAMREQAQSQAADVRWGREQELEGIRQGNRIQLEQMRNAGKGRRGRFGETASGDITPQPTPANTNDGGGGVTAKAAYDYLVAKGRHPMVAAGLVGNFDAESSWRHSILGDAGASYGFGQWNGARRDNLFRFANMRGHESPTPQDQLDFMWFEAESGSDPGAAKAIALAEKARTPSEAADIIRTYYERPKPGPTDQTIRRRRVAEEVASGKALPDSTGTAPQTVSVLGGGGLGEEDINYDDYLADWEKDELDRLYGDKVIIGHGAYSAEAIGMVDPAERQNFMFPLYKNDAQDAQEYLLLANRESGELGRYRRKGKPTTVPATVDPNAPTTVATPSPDKAPGVPNLGTPAVTTAPSIEIKTTNVPTTKSTPPRGSRVMVDKDGNLVYYGDDGQPQKID